MKYEEFLKRKEIVFGNEGLEVSVNNSKLYDFQKAIVRWAVKKGRCAIFADCGMGKTLMQLDWCNNMPGKCIIAAPLAVAIQTVEEGKRNGCDIEYSRGFDTDKHVTVTNYEMIDKFNPGDFSAIVLDESSILKNYSGRFKTYLCDNWKLKYRLCCTATPAPNDFEEIGNHCEFLGIRSRVEMLSEFFLHDSGETSKWRLKKHGEELFWKWLASWSVYIRHPSDIGFDCDNEKFTLPKCHIENVKIETTEKTQGYLLPMEAVTLGERREARRDSCSERCDKAAEIVASNEGQFILWCDLNCESEMLAEKIDDSVEVRGSDPLDSKCEKLIGFASGKHRTLITKPSIAGFGMNFQNCHNMIFVGLSDSYEQFYQAVRRCWRFMQKNNVNVWVVTSSLEGAVVRNIQRKEEDAQRMVTNMAIHMKDFCKREIEGSHRETNSYAPSVQFNPPKFERAV